MHPQKRLYEIGYVAFIGRHHIQASLQIERSQTKVEVFSRTFGNGIALLFAGRRARFRVESFED
jgi:hypothetical protein